MQMTALRKAVVLKAESINPAHSPSEKWQLFSLPGYDEGQQCQYLWGRDIGSAKYVVPNKCILFNKLNVRFRRIWKVDDSSLNKICSTEFLPLVANDGVSPEFVYYALQSDAFTNHLAEVNTNTSGSHKRVDPDFILDSQIPLPDLPTQLRIAGVLGSIDEKIELNRKKIAELEALAKTIYDYWFVQFDFPDKNGKPYKSSGGKMVWNEQFKREVPEGWGVVTLSRLCSISTRQCSPNKIDSDLLEHYSIPAFDEGVYPSFDSPSEILSNKFVVPIGGILYSKLNAQFKRIWDPLHLTGLPIASSEFVIYVPINPDLRGFVYATLNDERFYKFANSISSCSTGSRKRFAPETTNRFPVVIPTENEIVERFSAVCSDLLESIRKCRIETEELKHTRNTLLPLLMNGQVEVG